MCSTCVERGLYPQNKQFKGGLGHWERWQAPRGPSREENLKLLTQKAKGAEGCKLSFPFFLPSFCSPTGLPTQLCLPTRCPRVVQGWGARDASLVRDWWGGRGLDQVSNSLQIISQRSRTKSKPFSPRSSFSPNLFPSLPPPPLTNSSGSNSFSRQSSFRPQHCRSSTFLPQSLDYLHSPLGALSPLGKPEPQECQLWPPGLLGLWATPLHQRFK